MTHFDELSDLAYRREIPEGEDNRAAQSDLWTAFFKLENWIFAVDASKPTETPSPFVGYLEEEPWLFVFTDSQKAYDFAKKYELLDKNNEALYLSLTPDSARHMLASAESQVVGIRVNEGDHGWFAPLANIEGIHTYLKTEGRL